MKPIIDLNGRKIRGYAIISKGDMPEKLQKGMWTIPSQSGNGKYIVQGHRYDKWSCNCPDYEKRKIHCKHIHAVRFWLQIKDKIGDEKFEPKQEIKNDVCPYCNSDKIIKRGLRKNKYVEKQRYSCKECNKKFIIDVAKKTKANGKIVMLVLDLYFKGISLRKIQDHLNQFYGIEISHMTIKRWIKKFMTIANHYANNMKPNVSGLWHTDEQMIKNDGSFLWVWNCMDSKTRFLLANNVTETRYVHDAREVFNKAKQNGTPDIVVTDGLHAYGKAIKKEFGWTNTQHIRADGITSRKKNNNMIERFHNTFRERDKVMRGFKGKENATFMTESFKTYYNFVRPHMSLGGLTPSQTAKIPMQNDRNRWVGLLTKNSV